MNKMSDNSLEKRKRSVLGRGLSALMTPTVAVPIKENSQKYREIELHLEDENKLFIEDTLGNKTLSYLRLDEITANPNQPRKGFDTEELNRLADSIKTSGLLQPILVRKIENGTGLQIVAGERRWRAAKIAGLEKIPAMITELSEKETLEVGLIENLQRTDLNPIEEAEGIEKLIYDFKLTQEEVGKVLGRDRSSISNAIRLLKLPNAVKNLVREKMLSAGSARAIITVIPEEKQIELAHKIITDGLSAREIEELVKNRALSIEKKKPNMLPPKRYEELEDALRTALGTKVKLKIKTNGSGELAIAFHSGEELERIVERIG